MKPLFSSEEQQLLLSLSRDVLENELKGMRHNLNNHWREAFDVFRGIFVTLRMYDDLRGCIGQIEPTRKLYDNVITLSKSAAFHDRRFSPVVERELDSIEIEISVLTDPVAVSGNTTQEKMTQIRPFIDGVVLKAERQSATYLPQVWDSFSDHDAFISSLSRKAGFSADYWKYNPVELLTYQVTHFKET